MLFLYLLQYFSRCTILLVTTKTTEGKNVRLTNFGERWGGTDQQKGNHVESDVTVIWDAMNAEAPRMLDKTLNKRIRENGCSKTAVGAT